MRLGRRRTGLLLAAAVLVVPLPQAFATPPDDGVGGAAVAPNRFDVTEATIGSIQDAFAARRLTCVELVRSYLNRIETFDEADGQEWTTNAIQSVNDTALHDAARMDAAYAQDGPTGPLHCIPVLVKDQLETKDMPTTYGSALFDGYHSHRDATVVARLRRAGALILAKTNMGEFASGWAGSAFGVCRNPYDLARAPSSSSCGTGAGVAANYGTVGIAEDTGGSTRGPAAWNNAVGLRPTTPLISRHGMMPAQPTYDTVGPLTRTVTDAALVTNAIAGYDPRDPFTAHARGNVEDDYADDLDRSDLRGKRIGVIRVPMDEETDTTTADYARVRAVVNRAYGDLEALGATLVDPVRVPGLRKRLTAYDKAAAETEQAVDRYLRRLPDPPVGSFAEIAYSKVLTPTRRERLRDAVGRSTDDRAYLRSQQDRQRLRQAVLNVMAKRDLDAIAYATFDHEAPVIPEDQLTNPKALKGVRQGNNRELAPVTGFPALAVPAGFTRATHLPVGVDLLGRPWTEELLLQMGYAYEQGTHHRTPPSMDPRPTRAR
jgi:amidase